MNELFPGDEIRLVTAEEEQFGLREIKGVLARTNLCVYDVPGDELAFSTQLPTSCMVQLLKI